MKNSPYFHQVRLILRVIPCIASEKRFALKGGTAINLFVRDMPRLSIDIDLVWLPLQPRNAALTDISSALNGVANGIRGRIPQSSVQENRLVNTDHVVRLLVRSAQTVIKIEPNLVLRGTVFPCEERRLCKAAEDIFELTTTATTASMADLYAGKLWVRKCGTSICNSVPRYY
ncbi:MAG: nucleotidyl transferase AbiEii/AbiGii toxin family protein [Desulfatiglandales bacterium]